MILSLKQYEKLMEDLHDLAVVAERRPETLVSLEVANRSVDEFDTGLP